MVALSISLIALAAWLRRGARLAMLAFRCGSVPMARRRLWVALRVCLLLVVLVVVLLLLLIGRRGRFGVTAVGIVAAAVTAAGRFVRVLGLRSVD